MRLLPSVAALREPARQETGQRNNLPIIVCVCARARARACVRVFEVSPHRINAGTNRQGVRIGDQGIGCVKVQPVRIILGCNRGQGVAGARAVDALLHLDGYAANGTRHAQPVER